jgi:hypothetical protein
MESRTVFPSDCMWGLGYHIWKFHRKERIQGGFDFLLFGVILVSTTDCHGGKARWGSAKRYQSYACRCCVAVLPEKIT